MGRIILPTLVRSHGMASPLAERHCVVCRPGTPTLPQTEIDTLLRELDGWSVVQSDDHLTLTRTFRFKGFMPGVDLIDRIAPIAEAEAHHPDLHITYGALKVDLWTHAAGGLTENDFVLAAKIDKLANP